LDRVQAHATVPGAPSVPMKSVWRTIRDYILWSYERGTVQYDVMVTLILLFVLFSPYWINFKDKPVEHNPHRTGVVVTPDEQGGLIYQVEARAVQSKDDAGIRSELLTVIEPISGAVTIVSYDAVSDGKGKVQSYKVVAKRE
jgi:hypothetical protein